MSLKNFIRDIHQDLRGGIGSISRRSLELRIQQQHSRSSHAAAEKRDQDSGEQEGEQQEEQGLWAGMPAELLRDIIQRLESSDNAWPARRNVVACAAVCSSWREITKDVVKAPEISGKLTFPISLKQPGPKEATVQCYIKRDRTTATYRLYLGLSSTLIESGKFLLSARKFRRATSTDYIISIDRDDISRSSTTCIGKLRSNFLGTKFAIYDTQPQVTPAAPTRLTTSRRKQVFPKLPPPFTSYNVAQISYELNVLGTRGPRRMQCTLHTIGASSLTQTTGGESESEASPLLSSSTDEVEDLLTFLSAKPSSNPSSAAAPGTEQTPSAGDGSFVSGDPLVLKNKSPRWHEQLQCWCLNFRGRVTVASVKNFQLVAAAPDQSTTAGGGSNAGQGEQDKVLLQFGKIGKDTFTMDYRYPLSAFQAFAICLSSFDTKLACE